MEKHVAVCRMWEGLSCIDHDKHFEAGDRRGGDVSKRGNYILLRKSEVAVEMELFYSTRESRNFTEEMSRGGSLTVKTIWRSQVKIVE